LAAVRQLLSSCVCQIRLSTVILDGTGRSTHTFYRATSSEVTERCFLGGRGV
jgi:hypothetical protein